MALEMRALVAARSFGDGHKLELRIGISSGPVVAGVIGSRSSSTTYREHRQSHGLARGPQVIKGKGELPTWLLVGKRVPA